MTPLAAVPPPARDGPPRGGDALRSAIHTSARPILNRLPALVGVAAAAPLFSALRSPAFPVPVRVALAALWILAVVRPADALVVLALAVPFGSAALAAADGAPVRLTEALVLATLSGASLASLADPGRRASTTSGAVPFAVIVAASLAVVLGAREIGVHAPWLELRSLAFFITHDYLVGPSPEFAGVSDAMLLLEGLGLLCLVRLYSQERTSTMIGALAAAGAGAAVLSIEQAAADAPARGLVAALVHARASGPVSDVNAAGSFFAMIACMAVALAMARRTTPPARLLWGGLTAALAAGVWLSGSRMAVVALAVGAAAVGALLRIADARRRRSVVIGLALAAAAALILLTVGLDPRPAAARTASQSVSARAAFMLTGLRMMASAPVFGVGVGRYYEMSGSFMPESIYWFYFHENAHNNFLQIGGELGLLGLGVFLAMLGAAALRLARAARSGDPPLVALAVGGGAFILTWMTSHPLLVGEVAYAFWIVLGAALARADLLLGRDAAVGAPERGQPRDAIVLVALLIVAAGSIPFRILASRPAEPLDRLSFGFYDWENDHGYQYRWTSRRSTFFIPSSARELRLRMRSMMIIGHTDPVTFRVALDGRVLDALRITQGDWQTMRLRLPPASDDRGFTRVDVITDPPWIPAETGPSQDVRVLGVQLGKPETE